MPFIISLSDTAARRIDLCGGKGAGLARLVQGGFQVPPGHVITTEAYRATVAALPGFAEQAASHAGVPAAAAHLRARLLACPLPPPLVAGLAAVLDPAQPYAVRSSATLEDLGSASFAGQHDTLLGCTGLEAVLHAVRVCFASFWGDRAVAYRGRHGIGDAGAAMAVVVQPMVAAQAAGVAFTLDPVGGRLDEIHISAHPGLGEAVVNGDAEVDRFVFGKAALDLRATDTPRAAPCLAPAEAAAVADAARGIEAAFGFPQDVEWAIDGAGEVQVLQARPVTAIPARWTRDESAERFPNPVTPLAWDFAEAGFHAALQASFARMGLPQMPGRWFAAFGGYVYGDQNAVELYLGRPLVPAGPLEALHEALPGLVRRFAWVGQLPGEWAATLDRFLVEVGRLDAVPLAELTRREVWAHIGRLNEAGRAYFRHNIAISIGHAALHRALRELLGRLLPGAEAAAAYDVLVRPVETRTAAVNTQLDALAALAGADPGLRDLLRGGDARGTIEGGRLAPYPAFQQALQALLRDHGHRELDFDPYYPGWDDAPWAVLQAVSARLDGASPARDTMADRLAAAAALRRLEAGLPDDLALLLHELVRLARLYTELDDNEHYQTARLGPLLRRAVAALGHGLAADGVIAAPLDLFFATEAALDDAVAQDRPECWQALAVGIAQAKADHRAQGMRSPPWSLDAAAPEPDGEGMTGIPGSPGCAVAPAYIVRSPDDFADCPAGAILVVRATTPAWTALFARAAGIIAESGGPLSHGAIAAREQGIPAVMAVRDAMARLVNGQVVRLDGSHGTVGLVA